jgi:hypothetical protein
VVKCHVFRGRSQEQVSVNVCHGGAKISLVTIYTDNTSRSERFSLRKRASQEWERCLHIGGQERKPFQNNICCWLILKRYIYIGTYVAACEAAGQWAAVSRRQLGDRQVVPAPPPAQPPAQPHRLQSWRRASESENFANACAGDRYLAPHTPKVICRKTADVDAKCICEIVERYCAWLVHFCQNSGLSSQLRRLSHAEPRDHARNIPKPSSSLGILDPCGAFCGCLAAAVFLPQPNILLFQRLVMQPSASIAHKGLLLFELSTLSLTIKP